MASAILRSARALRHRLPGLLSSTTRSTPRALDDEGRFLVRHAGLPAMGYPRLFSSSAAGRSYAVKMCCDLLDTVPWKENLYEHPCKLNLGRKRLVGMEGELESITMAVKKDARGWREMREQFELNQIKRAQVDKQHDRVVLYASAAVTLALLGAEYVVWSRRKDAMAEEEIKPLI